MPLLEVTISFGSSLPGKVGKVPRIQPQFFKILMDFIVKYFKSLSMCRCDKNDDFFLVCLVNMKLNLQNLEEKTSWRGALYSVFHNIFHYVDWVHRGTILYSQ